MSVSAARVKARGHTQSRIKVAYTNLGLAGGWEFGGAQMGHQASQGLLNGSTELQSTGDEL